MSFIAQEQALLDLLFDPALRADFCKNAIRALAHYDLDEAELSDFLCIRPDALELDAAIRTDLILAQTSRQYPVTFSLLLSFAGGLACLQELVDSELMRSKPFERNVHLGSRLREKIKALTYESAQEYAFVNAILEAELAMVYTSAVLKEAVVNGLVPENSRRVVPPNWLLLPIELAPYVSAGVIPLPYMQLKKAFCPCEGLELWRQLNVSPMSVTQRSQVLKKPDVRLLVARASVNYASSCEPAVDFSTVELAEGFAPLFQYVDGENSVANILEQLQQAGAQTAMLESIRDRFMQLLEQGMLNVKMVYKP